MNHKGLTLLEVVVIIVVIGILAALLLPPTCGGHGRRQLYCASNLRQLYQLGTIYASAHKGSWPDERGSALWLSFAKTMPPFIEREHLEMLGCPLQEDWEPGQCDY